MVVFFPFALAKKKTLVLQDSLGHGLSHSLPPPAPGVSRRAAARKPRTVPTVSVVVASTGAAPMLDRCLTVLFPQCVKVGAELIVARDATAAEVARLGNSYPNIRVVSAPAGTGLPQLRGLGMAEAIGDIVALTEDQFLAADDWVEMLLKHSVDGADVVGGSLDKLRPEGTVDWAAYFAEHGVLAATRPDGDDEAPLLSAANVAYRRHVVGDVVAWAQRGDWEDVIHDRLVERGRILRFIRTAAVCQQDSHRFWPFCADRFRNGMQYARRRLGEEPGSSRWMRLATSPLLPSLLTWRVARAAAAGRWGTFIRALPATFVFLTAWSLGEAAGYARGAVGKR